MQIKNIADVFDNPKCGKGKPLLTAEVVHSKTAGQPPQFAFWKLRLPMELVCGIATDTRTFHLFILKWSAWVILDDPLQNWFVCIFTLPTL